MSKPLMMKCDGIHVYCPESCPCPYCVPVWPLRYEDGRFAPWCRENAVEYDEDDTKLVEESGPDD